MINLAGRPDAHLYVAKELTKAGINIVFDENLMKREVSVAIAGQYGSFKFERAWYYWVVFGKVPLNVAQELYDSEVGKKDVRVAGHCGCPPPKEWARWFDDQGLQLVSITELKRANQQLKRMNKSLLDGYRGVPKKDFSKYGKPYITSYHIDSQAGLNLFIETLKQNNVS